MRRWIAVLLLGMFFAAFAQDPLQTDPDKYKLLLQNDRVRVLEYRDKPGDKTRPHSHHAYVLYALSSFKRRLTLADGRTVERSFKAGETMWSDAQTHVGENIGDTETHVLIVELLEPAPPSQAK